MAAIGGSEGGQRCGGWQTSQNPNPPKPRLAHLIHLPLLIHHPEILAFTPPFEGEREEWELLAKSETATTTAVID